MMLQDLRYGWRALTRSPGFTAVAVLSLMIGIGATSTLFTLVNATVFRPLPYRDAAQLMDLFETSRELCDGCGVGTSYPTYLDWQAQATSFARMGAAREGQFALAGDQDAERVSGAVVSASLFPTLGVQPAMGRLFTADDDRVGAPHVVLLSYGVWQRRFGSDSSAVGRTIRVNGEATTIVGVMPPKFGFPEFAEAWMPLAPAAAAMPRSDRSLTVIARRRDGVAEDRAREEMQLLGTRVAATEPATFRNWSASAQSLRADLSRDSGPPFFVLLGAGAFVLLIACANLANLTLSRASRRAREFAIRVALGAGRVQLVRLVLVESIIVACGGGALGLILALWGIDLIPGALNTPIPFWIQFTIDWRVVLFTVGVTLATGIAFGLVPALRASRPDLQGALKEGGGNVTVGGGRGRLRGLLVVAEVALALVLLAGAGLMLKTLTRAGNLGDLGYDPRNVVTGSLHLLESRYDNPAQIRGFAASLLERVGALPGVEGASLSHERFLGTFVGNEGSVTLEGARAAVPDAIVPRFAHSVSADYFRVLRVPALRGRTISAADRDGAPLVAVVNEAAAHALWPDADALGRRLKLGRPGDAAPWLTVVGVVRDVVGSPVAHTVQSRIYTALAQLPGRPLSLSVRATADPLSLAPVLRTTLRAVDADQPLDDVSTLEGSLAAWVGPVRFVARLLGGLAMVAILLAAIGIYGVMSYAVTQRTHEIGIRVALGASTGGVLRLLVGYGVQLTSVGLAFGLAGAFALTRVLRSMLFGASATDPIVFAVVAILLAIIAVVASYLPARRALAIEPTRALKSE
jgi:putative ABC transport system permease protein